MSEADRTPAPGTRPGIGPEKGPGTDTSLPAGMVGVRVKAWDFPTRAFHWALVALIISAYLTRHYGDDELYWHKLNGYSILTLVLFRVLWGFVGGSTARFTAFIRGPRKVATYTADLATGRPRKFLGHNPAGGAMILGMLGLLLFQAGTGLFANDDILAEGPLMGLVTYDMSTYLTKLHLRSFDVILVVIGLHLAAIALYLLWKKENLIWPMITGYKTVRPYEDEHEARFGSGLVALLCLLVAAGCVAGGITLAGGTLL